MYGESIQTENESKIEKTKSEANFLATIRIESNNGSAKAGGKKTLALPADFVCREKKKLILNQNNNKAWHR